MRILAIRGENLASLCDPFEVDFEIEPIRRGGPRNSDSVVSGSLA